MRLLLILIALVFTSSSAQAQQEFRFTFDWGDIPLCITGKSGPVANPFFKLENVPKNTAKIYFRLKDEDRPKSKHGGGMVQYRGDMLIKPGEFEYKSPCPPDGQHTYTWTAYPLDSANRVLGTATSSVKYPQE